MQQYFPTSLYGARLPSPTCAQNEVGSITDVTRQFIILSKSTAPLGSAAPEICRSPQSLPPPPEQIAAVGGLLAAGNWATIGRRPPYISLEKESLDVDRVVLPLHTLAGFC